MTPLTRRTFLTQTSLASLAMASGCSRRATKTSQIARPLFAGIGITAPLSRAAEMKAAGADYLAPTVADLLVPDKPESDFERIVDQLAAAPLPVLGCNSFLRHARLRCTGPDAAHDTVLDFCAIAFRRLASIGGKFIGFGSNTARRIPDDWPTARADEQFVALLHRMGPLAAEHGLVIAVEQQRHIECNYLNHMAEVREVVRATNHPNIRILADFYHMGVVGDTPADLDAAMPWVGFVELAEPARRTLPGVDGYDFRPWFRSLRNGGYEGHMNIEGNGTPAELKTAFATIRQQATEVG